MSELSSCRRPVAPRSPFKHEKRDFEVESELARTFRTSRRDLGLPGSEASTPADEDKRSGHEQEEAGQPPRAKSPDRMAAEHLIGRGPPLAMPTLLVSHYPGEGVLTTARETFTGSCTTYCRECGQPTVPVPYEMPSEHFRNTIETCLEEALWKAGALSGKDVNELRHAFTHVLTVRKPNPRLEAAAVKTMQRYQEGRVQLPESLN